MVDWIPGISQIKSTFQLICGDVDGAAKTQENFVRQCPVVSQITSTVQLIAGDADGALETQKRCFGTISRVADGVPVIGHAKGLVHYAVGDEEGGNRAMKSSTRTLAVVGAGAAGFVVGGPVGAVVGGVTAGSTTDVIYTEATGKSHGIVAAIEGLEKNPTPGGFFDTVCIPVGDAMAGMSGGNIAKSINNRVQLQNAARLESKGNAALEFAENARDAMKLPEGDILKAYDTAKQYHDMASNIRSNVNGVPQGAGFSGKLGSQTGSTASKSSSATGAPVNMSQSDEDSIRSIHNQRGRKAEKSVTDYVSQKKSSAAQRSPSKERHGRGEHVINNAVIKVYRDIIERVLQKLNLNINDIRRTDIYNTSLIIKAYDNPLSESVKKNIANVMIAHIPSDVQYIDTNADIFGRLIQVLQEPAVNHVMELYYKDTLGPTDGSKYTATIKTTIQQINSNKVYVDETALKYWLAKSGSNSAMYEQSREAVYYMFFNLYDKLHNWASELRRFK